MTQTKEQMQAKIKEMQAILDEMPDEPKPWPKDGELVYWCSDINVANQGRFASGDLFYKALTTNRALKRTKEEAQAVANFRMSYTKFGAMNGGFVPDWKDREQKKWYPKYDNETERWEAQWACYYQFSQLPHFPTQEMLEQAIEAMGSDMNYLLGEPV